jgi:hypothetical protein
MSLVAYRFCGIRTDRFMVDRPLTDLYNTEGDGGFPGPTFFARPVVGGHFSFLALERACGGKAVEGLSFLDDAKPREIDIARAMREEEVDEVMNEEL